MKKRTMIFVTAMVLLFAIVTGATLAYMTDTTDPVRNTFTYGSVIIDLDEGQVGTDGKHTDDGVTRVMNNSYRLYPGSVYDKDPVVYVGSAKGSVTSEDCYIFVKVVNPIKDLEASGASIAEQMADLGWLAIDANAGVYYYDGKTQGTNDTTATVSDGEKIKVFETVTIAANAEFDGEYAAVTVQAFAVQAEGFTSASDAWTKLGTAKEQPEW